MTVPPEDQENYDSCICGSCPSYPGNDPRLYCARGKSEKKVSMEGCICPAGCPVYAKHKLRDMFYCVYGKAK